MKTTGLFTIHEFTINIKELNEPIYLIPFGDVHKDAPLHSSDKWHEFLEWAKSKPNAYFMGMGDYCDFMSASERKSFQCGSFHDSTADTLEELSDKHVDSFYRDIEFMQNRIVGLIEGNHYFQYSSGITSTQKLCEKLKCKYLGVMTMTRLRFLWKGNSSIMDIYAHHGKGAARLLGGSLTRVQQMAESADADIYLMGHDHKGPIGFNPRLKLSQCMGNLQVVERKQFFGRTGSFLRGYVPDEVSYVADACLNPANLGVMKLDFIPHRKGHDALSIDMHASI